MQHASTRRKPENGELESRQLTLEEWAKVLRTSPGDDEARGPERIGTKSSEGGRQSGGAGTPAEPMSEAARHRRPAAELLETPGALLTRSHLRELGLERRAIDAVFRKLAIVFLPGYSRPMVRVEEYLELIRQSTYRDDRVRPSHA